MPQMINFCLLRILRLQTIGMGNIRTAKSETVFVMPVPRYPPVRSMHCP